MNNNKQFPQYRRLSSLDVYYKICSDREFLEVKKLGTKWMVMKIIAHQYPERLRIMDMLANEMQYVSIEELGIIELIEEQISMAVVD